MIAGRRFEPGEAVWKLTGKPVFGAVTESGPNYIGIGPDVWIDPDLPFDHINHHCAPNAAFGAAPPADRAAPDRARTKR